MLIQCTTGRENFQSGSANCFLFVCGTSRFPGKEIHVGLAAKDSARPVRIVGAPQTFPAAAGFVAETGQWTTASYEVPDGVILKVFTQRTGGFGAMRIQAAQFIRARRDAAYRRVSVILTGHAKATFQRVTVEGRFDLFSLEDVAREGILVPPHFRPPFDESMIRRAFEFSVIEPEMAAPAQEVVRQVENASGEKVEVRETRKNRMLDL